MSGYDHLPAELLISSYQEETSGRGHSAAGDGFEACGNPAWSEQAWNEFRAKHGFDPFSREELPPDLEHAPAWVFRRLGMRPPLMVDPR